MCEVDSADIAARIKAAIKAKLVEMEAYVDDELPDYIMVMIANKKTKDQMLTDLNLFLGQNTPKFVDWIHEVLHRLQTITLDMKKKEDHKEGRAKTHRKIKKARTTKSAAASGETSKSPGSDSSPKQIMDIPSESTSLETAATSSSNNQEKLVLESAESLVAMSSQSTNNALEPEDNGSAKPPEQQDVLAIRAEDGDDFGNDDEVETIEDQSVVSSTQPSSTTAAAPVKSTVQKTYEESPGKGEKRGRTVNSTIGAVVSREEEEEEYDPRRPAIGTVASIVRTQRRPSLPVGMQAPRTLLMKAVHEAEKSVSQAAHKRQARVEPYQHAPDEDSPPTKRRTVILTTDGSGSSMLGGGEVFGGKRTRSISLTSPENRPSKKLKSPQAATQMPRGRKAAAETFQEESSRYEMADAQLYTPTPKASLTPVRPSDDDLLLMDDDENELMSSPESSPEEDRTADRLQYVLLPSTSKADVKSRLGKRQPVQPPSPEFVITLDGAGFSGSTEADPPKSVAGRKASVLQRLGARVRTLSNASDDNTQLALLKSLLEDGDDLDEGVAQLLSSPADDDVQWDETPSAPVVPQVQKVKERCRYWPACKNGDQCPYHHPTRVCITFPNCKFGEKCLFIHPNCRYDAKCMRPDCPFTHTRRTTLPQIPIAPVFAPMYPTPAPAPTQVCRFFPGCINPVCPFLHPKMCRWGEQCTRADCVFVHPKEKYKWNSGGSVSISFSPNKAPTSERVFADPGVPESMPVTVETSK